MTDVNELLLGDVKEGSQLPVLEKDVTPVTVVLGAMASRDWRPQHHDYKFAVNNNGVQDIFVAEYPAVDLAVDKTSGAFYAPPGGPIEYLVVVENLGVASAEGAQVVDFPPKEIGAVSWTCAAFAGAVCGAASGSIEIDETVTLPAGGSVVYTLTGSVPPDWTDPITNTASVTTPAGLLELVGSNNSDSDTDRVALFADGMESVEPD